MKNSRDNSKKYTKSNSPRRPGKRNPRNNRDASRRPRPYSGRSIATSKPVQPPKKVRGPKPLPKTGPLFPMRINKYLAQEGYATRRGADELIEKKWVVVNGKVAVLGDKINEGDLVEVKHNRKAENYKYYAYYKSRGVSMEKIVVPPELSPLIGLDTQAGGLVLFSNDRRPIDRLASTKYSHQKEYYIKTHNDVRPNLKEKIEQGVILAGGESITAHVHIKDDRAFILKTSDSGSHIRQLCSLFNAEIESLTRTRILNVGLNGLQPEQNRELEAEELELFLKTLGL